MLRTSVSPALRAGDPPRRGGPQPTGCGHTYPVGDTPTLQVGDPSSVSIFSGHISDTTNGVSTNTHTMCSGSVISTGDPSTVCTNHTRIR